MAKIMQDQNFHKANTYGENSISVDIHSLCRKHFEKLKFVRHSCKSHTNEIKFNYHKTNLI